MTPIRLIGIDLDGTFLSPDGTPTPASLRVLTACRQAGIRVCICTGRSLAQIQSVLAFEAELDELCVLTNGASIVNWRTGEYVLRRRIDPEVVDPLLRALTADCQSVPGRHMSVTGMHQTHMLRSCTRPQFLDGWDGTMVPTRMIHRTLEAFIEASRDDIQRIDYSVPYSDGERVQALLRPIAELDITTGDPRRLELIPKGINKGEGLSRLAEHYDIPRQSVMAIGDGINDDSMILWAGLGVAMGNAVESLKELADALTETNAQDGFAKAVLRYALAVEQTARDAAPQFSFCEV